MAISRETVESLYQDYWSCLNAANWAGLIEHFSSECTFTNSAMQEVIKGKSQLQEVAATWPPVDNFPDWHAIDGSRLVVGWKEKPSGGEKALAYRGISSFLINDEGKISDYVGTFNMQEVIRAYAP